MTKIVSIGLSSRYRKRSNLSPRTTITVTTVTTLLCWLCVIRSVIVITRCTSWSHNLINYTVTHISTLPGLTHLSRLDSLQSGHWCRRRHPTAHIKFNYVSLFYAIPEMFSTFLLAGRQRHHSKVAPHDFWCPRLTDTITSRATRQILINLVQSHTTDGRSTGQDVCLFFCFAVSSSDAFGSFVVSA